jgi:hypothetical protein
MDTVERLEEALAAARRSGFQIRMEWLGGDGGGDCEIQGKKWIFIDLANSPAEQLEQVLQALERAGASASAAESGSRPRRRTA